MTIAGIRSVRLTADVGQELPDFGSRPVWFPRGKEVGTKARLTPMLKRRARSLGERSGTPDHGGLATQGDYVLHFDGRPRDVTSLLCILVSESSA